MSFLSKADGVFGPLEAISLQGWWRALDRGNGSRILAPRFKTKVAAEKWIAKQSGPGGQKEGA